ncbi:MAG: hypothetical protein DMD87_29585, partial [Candidatus Rokuibacteriota bacterium]
MTAPGSNRRALLGRPATFALALGLWFTPIPSGLTSQAWHLFAIFAAAIFSVIVAAFPLLTAAMLAAAAAVLTGTIAPAKAFAGFANGSVLLVVVAFLVASSVVKSGLGRRISFLVVSAFGRSTLGLAYSIFLTDAAIAPALAFAGFANGSVLLVVVAFLVASSVVKSGLGRRISFLVVSAFGRSTLGLAYSIFLTDAAIAPAFPSNTARSGVLYPIVLSLAEGAGSTPHDEKKRRVGGYLMFCGMASLAVSSALWLTATSVNPIGVEIARQFGLKIDFGSWLLAASVPALAAALLLPVVLYWLFPPGVRATPDAPAAARAALRSMGPLTRDEKVVAVAFLLMVTGWVTAGTLKLDLTAVAFGGLGALLATSVLTLDDIAQEGGTLATYLWLAVLFA